MTNVFILEEHHGQGLSKLLLNYIIEVPVLQGLRRMLLVTADAHKLYEKYNFTALNNTNGFMEIWQPEIYDENS